MQNSAFRAMLDADACATVLLVEGKRKSGSSKGHKRKARKGSQRDLINGLFRRAGPLYGKKHASYAISRVHPDGIGFDLARFVRNKNKKEENCIISLIRTIGWPDESETVRPDPANPEQTVKVDALYRDAFLVVECDEVQHFDVDHLFNQGDKRGYQRHRDRLVNEYYTQQGYYVVRLNATTGPYRVDAMNADQLRTHPSGLLWYPAENSEVLRRAREVARVVIEARQRNYERGDFAGKLLCVPDDESGSFARRWFDADSVNAKATLAAQGFTDAKKAQLRGTVDTLRLAMAAAAARLEAQARRPDVEADQGGDSTDGEEDGESSGDEEAEQSPQGSPAPIPVTQASGLGIDELAGAFKSVLHMGEHQQESGGTTEYERYWRAVMRSYSPEGKYQERLQLIDSERVMFASRSVNVK